MATRAIANCPKCGMKNDVTAQAKADAMKSPPNQLVTVTAKCERCGAAISYGPFDPFAAQQGLWP